MNVGNFLQTQHAGESQNIQNAAQLAVQRASLVEQEAYQQGINMFKDEVRRELEEQREIIAQSRKNEADIAQAMSEQRQLMDQHRLASHNEVNEWKMECWQTRRNLEQVMEVQRSRHSPSMDDLLRAHTIAVDKCEAQEHQIVQLRRCGFDHGAFRLHGVMLRFALGNS